MKTINEQLLDFLTENLGTASACEFDIDIDDWSVGWSGSGTLTLEVSPDGVCVNSIDGYDLDEILVTTRSDLERALGYFEPEAKEEECVTADDIRYVLEDLRLLTEHNQRLNELDTEQVIQLILGRATSRKSSY